MLVFRDMCSGDVVNDPLVKNVVVDQTKQWSEMVTRQRKEELDMRRQHLLVQEEILKKLMEQIQAQQIKDLEAIFERYVGSRKLSRFYQTRLRHFSERTKR